MPRYLIDTEGDIHLDGPQEYTICGIAFDAVVDESLAAKDYTPFLKETASSQVTCQHCLGIIGCVLDSLQTRGKNETTDKAP